MISLDYIQDNNTYHVHLYYNLNILHVPDGILNLLLIELLSVEPVSQPPQLPHG